MVASVGIYVQAFFLWRLYMISGRKWLPPALLSPVLLLAYTAVALAVRIVVIRPPHPRSRCPADILHLPRGYAPHLYLV